MTVISRFFCALNRAIHHCVVFTAGAFDYCNAIPEYTLWRRRAANVTERLLHRTGGLVRLLSLTWHTSEACSQHQNWTGVEYGVLTDHVLSNRTVHSARAAVREYVFRIRVQFSLCAMNRALCCIARALRFEQAQCHRSRAVCRNEQSVKSLRHFEKWCHEFWMKEGCRKLSRLQNTRVYYVVCLSADQQNNLNSKCEFCSRI